MVRNTGCENSDGCSAAVLERMVVDPGQIRRDTGHATLSPWLTDEKDEGPHLPPQPDLNITSDLSGTYPTFELGIWRFTVKTGDLSLIEELGNFVREIVNLPRSDVKFTFKLVLCTEEGRLGGWAWQKVRMQNG
jgi:hypothetical protein